MMLEVQSGVDVHFLDVGLADAPAVVFLHASGFSHRVWERQILELSGQFRTVAIDLRGHGYSGKPAGGYNPSRVASDVLAVLEHLDLRDVTLVGWSRGGAIAVRAAALQPSRIGRLMLVAPSGPFPLSHPENPGGATVEDEAAILAALRTAPEEFRWSTVASMPKRPYSYAMSLDLFAQFMMSPSWAASSSMQAHFQEDYRSDAEKLEMPTLIVLGRADSIAPEARVREYEKRIAGSRFEWFEESGHSPNLEEPDRFNRVLREFAGSPVR